MQQNSLVHYFQGNFRLRNGIEFKLFFVNKLNSARVQVKNICSLALSDSYNQFTFALFVKCFSICTNVSRLLFCRDVQQYNSDRRDPVCILYVLAWVKHDESYRSACYQKWTSPQLTSVCPSDFFISKTDYANNEQIQPPLR